MDRLNKLFKKEQKSKCVPVKFLSMKIVENDIYNDLESHYKISRQEELYATISEVLSETDASMPDPAEVNRSLEGDVKKSDASLPDPTDVNQSLDEVKESDASLPHPTDVNPSLDEVKESGASLPDQAEINRDLYDEVKKSEASLPDPDDVNEEANETDSDWLPDQPEMIESQEYHDSDSFPDPPEPIDNDEEQISKINFLPMDNLKVEANSHYGSLTTVNGEDMSTGRSISWSNQALPSVSDGDDWSEGRHTALRLANKEAEGTNLWISANDPDLNFSGHPITNVKVPPLGPNQTNRDEWSNRMQFILSCVGLSAGIGNVWRFPFLAYSNGGAAFLFAYTILLLFVGKPLYFMELAWGQFCQSGPVGAFGCCKLGKGIGYSMFVISLLVCVYYNVIVAYCIFYLFHSFLPVLPWEGCDHWWLKDNSTCYHRDSGLRRCKETVEMLVFENVTEIMETYDEALNETTTYSNVTGWVFETTNCTNSTIHTSAQLFWERYVLDISDGIDYPGSIQYGVLICLVIAWVITFCCVCTSIKSSGKVFYFTSTFPFVILIILLVRGVTLDGAVKGLEYFFIPEWKKLLDIEVWHKAAEQLFFSLSVSMGSLYTYGSFNKSGKTIARDAVLVSYIDFATSILASIVIFSVLGNMSHDLGIPIEKVAQQGQGLAFVTYPEALSRLWFPQLWSALFFFMLFLLGLDSEFAMLEVVLTTIMDKIPRLRKLRFLVAFLICGVCLTAGLVCVLQNGQYVLNLWDTYGGGTSTVFTSFCEVVCLMWGYGLSNFVTDLKKTLGTKPNWFWQISWVAISPLVLLFICGWTSLDNQPLTYGNDYDYPYWGKMVGWAFVAVSAGLIPIMAIGQLWLNRSHLAGALDPDEEFALIRLKRHGIATASVPLFYFRDEDSLSSNRMEFDSETESNDSNDSFNLDVAPIIGVVGGRHDFVRRLSGDDKIPPLPAPLEELCDVSESRASI